MPFNGNGVFSRGYNWVNDSNNGLDIIPSRMDGDANDIALGLTQLSSKIISLQSGPFLGYVSANPLSETQTAVAGQTVFNLGTYTYSSGVTNAVSVYIDGFKIPQSAIAQTSNSSITLSLGTPLFGGEQVEIASGSFSSIMSGKVSATNTTTTTGDIASNLFRRNVEYSGGTPGFVNACIRADTFVNNASAAAFEWAIVGVVHNQATAGENVGGYFQGIKYAGAGPTWGATVEIIDQSAPNPTNGCVGLEVDITADGTDTNTARVGLDMVWRNRTSTGMHAAYGFRLNGSDTNATLDVGLGVTTGAKLGIGIDLSGASISGAAINLNTNQAINLGGNAGVPANTRQLYHNGSSYNMANSAGTTYWSFNDNGSLVVLGKQLLGAQATGYALMTGTVNRGTVYDTSTITLQQLAQRVAAIQNDILNLHGFLHT